LRENASKKPPIADPKAWEQANKIVLPPDYKRFITTVGRKSFKNVDDEEGYSVRLLPLRQLNAQENRRGEIDGESEVDGLMFAVAINGDCFCFDLASAGPDYSVVHFLHEINSFEPYATSFVECLRRFTGQ
jgi:hypothetical protein